MSTQGQGDVVARLDARFNEITDYCAKTPASPITERAPEHLALYQDAKAEILRLRTLHSSSRGEQGWRNALDELLGACQRYDADPCSTLAIAAYLKAKDHAAEVLAAASSAPGSVPTSLAGQGTDTCTCDEFQSCPRCHTANLDPDWLEKELAEVATQPTAGGDAPTPADERPEDYNCPKCGDIIHSRAHGIEGADCSCVKWEGPK